MRLVSVEKIEINIIALVFRCRWVSTLTSEEVADRIIVAILRREKYVILPGFLRFMLTVKW